MQYNHGQSESGSENGNSGNNGNGNGNSGNNSSTVSAEAPAVEIPSVDTEQLSTTASIVNRLALPDPAADSAAGVVLKNQADAAQETNIQLLNTIKEVISESKTVIFAYDYAQSLSITEEERNIPAKLQKIDGFTEYTLSDKIRTSKEIASFTRTMMNLNNRARGYMDYSDIDVLFANNIEEAKRLINLYDEKGYIFISYTQSMYYRNSIDLYPNNYDTHHVIGQEYDKVMIMMDKNFRYDKEIRIQGKEHPNPDLLFYKLLYQAISRAREKLCVLIVENCKLFTDILYIKFDMLSRYQYKENNTNITLSVKKLNRLTKSIKDKLSEVHDNYSLTISETVDMINDELMGAELKKKVIRNGIKLLKIIQNELVSEEIYELISKYCDYVEETTRTANTELCLLGD